MTSQQQYPYSNEFILCCCTDMAKGYRIMRARMNYKSAWHSLGLPPNLGYRADRLSPRDRGILMRTIKAGMYAVKHHQIQGRLEFLRQLGIERGILQGDASRIKAPRGNVYRRSYQKDHRRKEEERSDAP